jgi:hypothetical protein
MRAFVLAHQDELERAGTAIINVHSVGHGTLGYRVSEGAVASLPADRTLIGLCQALAASDAGAEHRFKAEPIRDPAVDDALPAIARGLPAITISTSDGGPHAPWHHRPEDTPDRIDSEALARATEFIVSLARLLDLDAGRRSRGDAELSPAAG